MWLKTKRVVNICSSGVLLFKNINEKLKQTTGAAYDRYTL